jgi:hypothetical protein
MISGLLFLLIISDWEIECLYHLQNSYSLFPWSVFSYIGTILCYLQSLPSTHSSYFLLLWMKVSLQKYGDREINYNYSVWCFSTKHSSMQCLKLTEKTSQCSNTVIQCSILIICAFIMMGHDLNFSLHKLETTCNLSKRNTQG